LTAYEALDPPLCLFCLGYLGWCRTTVCARQVHPSNTQYMHILEALSVVDVVAPIALASQLWLYGFNGLHWLPGEPAGASARLHCAARAGWGVCLIDYASFGVLLYCHSGLGKVLQGEPRAQLNCHTLAALPAGITFVSWWGLWCGAALPGLAGLPCQAAVLLQFKAAPARLSLIAPHAGCCVPAAAVCG
jgi:hypothetical protein